MANWVFLQQYEEVLNYINEFKYVEMIGENGKALRTQKMFGTSALGAVITSYVRDKEKAKEFWSLVAKYEHMGGEINEIIEKLIDKKIQIKNGKDANNASKIYYLFYASFENYCKGTTKRISNIKKPQDVLEKCFANGTEVFDMK